MNRHISRQYDSELEHARTRLMEMGGLVERLVQEAVQALVTHDAELARSVREDDAAVNRLEVELDETCVQIIARRQPAASDLRTLIAIMKASTDLERVGDESGRIAKAAIAVAPLEVPEDQYADCAQLYELVARLLSGALDALARRDADKALKLIAADAEVDAGYNAILRSTATSMHADPDAVDRGLNVIWAARALERIGDHAKNICEYTIFLVRGEDVRHSSLDPDAVANQMLP